MVVPLEAELFLIGIHPDHLTVGCKFTLTIDLCLLQAKRVTALRWKSTNSNVAMRTTNSCGQRETK